ncbi:MAG: tyrosine-protein phosphatase [Rhizobiaceae bacterium]
MVSAFRLKHILWVALLTLGLVAAYCGVLRATGNFHVVVAGQLYRSAQPTPGELRRYIRDYGIKTVINLRGSNPDRTWYREEVAATKKMGVAHIDFRMSARHILSPARAEELVAIMRAAQKPILVHCEGGADRTGLISAIYVGEIAHEGEHAAEGQLSLFYGHIGIPYLATYAMDESWERLEPIFGFKGS